jgi:hypothetical protein
MCYASTSPSFGGDRSELAARIVVLLETSIRPTGERISAVRVVSYECQYTLNNGREGARSGAPQPRALRAEEQGVNAANSWSTVLESHTTVWDTRHEWR